MEPRSAEWWEMQCNRLKEETDAVNTKYDKLVEEKRKESEVKDAMIAEKDRQIAALKEQLAVSQALVAELKTSNKE